MRIDDSFSASNDVRSTEVGRSRDIEQEQGNGQRRVGPQSDSASLSALGTELARAIETDPPDVVSRIEQLERAVQNGTFQADSSEVAQSLIDDSIQATQDGGDLRAGLDPVNG